MGAGAGDAFLLQAPRVHTHQHQLLHAPHSAHSSLVLSSLEQRGSHLGAGVFRDAWAPARGWYQFWGRADILQPRLLSKD